MTRIAAMTNEQVLRCPACKCVMLGFAPAILQAMVGNEPTPACSGIEGDIVPAPLSIEGFKYQYPRIYNIHCLDTWKYKHRFPFEDVLPSEKRCLVRGTIEAMDGKEDKRCQVRGQRAG